MNYDHVLLTIGEDKSRNKLVDKNRIYENVKPDDKDVLISLWYYGDEAVQFFQKHGSLKSYRGEMFSPYLPFDIDAHGEPLEIACSRTKELLDELKEKGIDSVKLSFSGGHGFHVIVPSIYFNGFVPSSTLPAQLLALAKHITKIEFDKAIYSHLRMFRLTNTLHHSSGLYKIPIREELLDFPDKILELAKTQQPVINYKKPAVISELVKLKDNCFNLVPEEVFSFSDSRPKMRLCIAKLLKGVKSGDRNNAACRIISHFKQEGYEPEVAYEFLHGWNKFNLPPEPAEELKSTFQSIWKTGYTYSCYDYLLDDLCDKDCYLFPEKSRKIETGKKLIHRFGEILPIYDNYIRSNSGVNLGFSKRIDKEIVGGIDPGDLVFIIARPSTYKSSLAQIIGYRFVESYYGYFLYISLEMSLQRLYERQIQVMTRETAENIRTNYQSIHVSQNVKERFLVADRKGMTLQEIKKLVLDWEKKNEKIEMIAIDFFHALRSEGGEAKTKAENALELLKHMAYDLNTRIITLVHTSRSEGGDSYKSLSMSAARDSAKFEDLGDFVFGLHKLKDEDDILAVQLLKNKKGNTLEAGIRMKRAKDTIFLEEDNSLYLPEEE